MLDFKTILSIIAIFITFIGYTPYFLDILKGKTRPHIFSWLVWGITTSIIFALQLNAGAGPGSWATLAVTLIVFTIFFLGLKNGKKDIKKIDVIFFILALLALPLWLIIKQPVFSIILLTLVDILGFASTIRKSWDDPHSETLLFYIITTFRHGLSFFALSTYNIVTWLSPVTWVVANALLGILLVARRRSKVLKNKN